MVAVLDVTRKKPLTFIEGKGFFSVMNSFLYDKPFKTYEEQIELIRQKNVIVDNIPFALNILSSISYYTLMNGYKSSVLYNKNNDCFVDGTTLSEIYSVHLVDNSLNNLIFKYILYVEKSLKTKLAYLIGRKYGVYVASEYQQIDIDSEDPLDDYLHASFYSSSSRSRTNILSQIREYTNNRLNSNSATAYYKKDRNHIPPWILFNDIPFGLIIKLYSILINEDKTEICDQMLPYKTNIAVRKELLKKSLDLLVKYRNSIAHGNKTFASNVNIELPKKALFEHITEPVMSEDDYQNGYGVNDTFAVLIMLILLINDLYILRHLLRDVHSILEPYENSSIHSFNMQEILNLPLGVEGRLYELLKIRFNK